MARPHAGFLRHADFRYLKLSLLLVAISVGLYAWHETAGAPGGGSWLGYTLGTVAAALVLWLTALGVRKRRYRSTLGTVSGWTSAHVYLGLSLVVIATLHCGFQFGLNIHTLAYVLLMGVIASGLYGIYAYSRYPALITENLGASDRETLLDEILEINEQGLKLADQLGPEVHRILLRSVERMRIGGGIRDQLFGPQRRMGRDEQDALRAMLDERQRSAPAAAAFDPQASATVIFMAGELAQARKSAADAEKARQLLELISRRNALVARVNRDIQLHARMQIWLQLHIPLTVGLLAALSAHVLSVFLYW